MDVKGQVGHNFWLVQRRAIQEDLFFILVLVASNISIPPEYFILSCKDMLIEMDTLKNNALIQGKVWTGKGEGINWGQSTLYHNKWDRLPE